MSDTFDPIQLSARDAELIALHAEDLLTADQAKELSQRLHDEPALLSAIAQFTEIEEHLRQLLDEQQAADRGDWYEVMAELARAEARAEVLSITDPALQPEQNTARSDQPSKKEVFEVLAYLGSRPAVWGPIAAVLVLAVSIVLVLVMNGGPAPTQPIAEDPPAPQTEKPVVATLTAEYATQWEEPSGESLRPGDELVAGQRLTLTRGFAEVTTLRGAVAILEAPCTIELIDSPNALRLHAGKIVGVCETKTSKGFMVRTPHMDIVDVGTRFGVDASGPDSTQVFVIEGEIELTANAPGQQPVSYTAGQAVSVNRSGASLPPVEALVFTPTMPKDGALTPASLGAVAYFPFDDGLTDLKQTLPESEWTAVAEGGALAGVRIGPGGARPIHDAAYTIALWLKPGKADEDRHIVSLTGPEGPMDTFSNQLSVAADGRVRHYVYSINPDDQVNLPLIGGEGLLQYSKSTLPGDAWTHIIATCSANGRMRLYINGRPDAQPVTVPMGLMFGSHYVLGGPAQTRTDGPELARKDLAPYQGGLDGLALFNRELSDSEVKTLYDAAEAARQQTVTTGGGE